MYSHPTKLDCMLVVFSSHNCLCYMGILGRHSNFGVSLTHSLTHSLNPGVSLSLEKKDLKRKDEHST